MMAHTLTGIVRRSASLWSIRGAGFRMGWLLLCMTMVLTSLPFAESASGAEAKVSFSIGETVSAEDAAYVREGITLGQHYAAEALSEPSDAPLAVNVRASDDTFCGHAVACTTDTAMVVFTGSPGWISLSPFDRVHVIVHEYIHVYQYVMLDSDQEAIPTWLIEGTAEYLSYDAIAQLGLVSARDVHDYHAWAVAAYPGMTSLDDLEGADAFYAEYGPAYSLAYLAIDTLMSERSPAGIDRLFKAIQVSGDWRSAFEEVFGLDITEFYRSFAEARNDLIAPVNQPKPFAAVVPGDIESPVFIYAASSPVGMGEQMVVHARAEAGANCQLRVPDPDSDESVDRTTFADASGHLFWLVTIPSTMEEGPVDIAVTCGGDPNTVEIDITG
jgi:hypothetical protein